MQQTPSSWQLHRLNICRHTASRCNRSGHKDQHQHDMEGDSHRDLLGFLASSGDVELEAGAGLRSLAQHRAQSAAVAGVALRAEDPVAVLEHERRRCESGALSEERRLQPALQAAMLTAAYSKGLLPVASEHVQHRQQHVLSSFRSSGDCSGRAQFSTAARRSRE